MSTADSTITSRLRRQMFPRQAIPFRAIPKRLHSIGSECVFTLLISPWIDRGTIISAPSDSQKPFPSSEFDLTSIPATVRKIFKLQSPCLTARSCWVATFDDEVLKRQTPRGDCPESAPDAPSKFMDREETARMKATAINDLQADYLELAASLRGMDDIS